jgi:glycosyltransferase involved in cell wall biosynthesis
MKKIIFYICTNDGTDARVSKEIKTLSKIYQIHYFGFIKEGSKKGISLDLCSTVYLVDGSPRSLISLIKFIKIILFSLSKYKTASIHIVDEEILIFLYFFLWGREVVLDIFDSLWLRYDKIGRFFKIIKILFYYLPNKIIVTDQNRKNLLPKCIQSKTFIVPNVPVYQIYAQKVRKSNELIIYLVGSLSKNRGVSFARKLISSENKIKVVAAGWIYDDYTKDFIEDPQVDYLGILNQDEINRRIALNGDYILAIYPLTNANNVNASPNKIYDAIQTKTPIIISSGTHASKIVNEMQIGFCVQPEDCVDFSKLSKKLIDHRFDFIFDDDEIHLNSWENYELTLLNCHAID